MPSDRTSFANVMTKLAIRRTETKRLFRKPFVKYPQALAEACYGFQIGGILACRFRQHAESFVTVFASPLGDAADAAQVMATESASNVASRLTPGCTILDFVVSSEIALRELQSKDAFYSGTTHLQLSSRDAAELIFYYTVDGAALGLGDPARFRELFLSSSTGEYLRRAGVAMPKPPPEILTQTEQFQAARR